MQHHTIIISGKSVEATLNRTGTRVEGTVDGRAYSFEATAVEPGVYCINVGGRSLEIVVVAAAEGYEVFVGPHRIPVEILDPRKALRSAARQGHDGAAEIRAPMPGKIVRLLVEEGAEVEANQGIVVMEAMKMQNEIKSPKKGRVQKLVATAGVTIASGDLIAIVE